MRRHDWKIVSHKAGTKVALSCEVTWESLDRFRVSLDEPGRAQRSVSQGESSARPGDPFLGYGGFTMNRVPKWFVLVLVLVFLLGLAAPVLAEEVKGKIKSVDA